MQVETFLHELESILLQRQLDPHDFSQILTVAHEIVDLEDPQNGPHAGMIIVLEDVLRARGGVQPRPVSASA